MSSGWRETSLGELVDIKHGFAFEGRFFTDDPNENVLLTPGNFAIGGGYKGDKLKYYDGPVPEEFVLAVGDVIVTMTDLSKKSDTLGYPAIVPAVSDLRFLHNQRLGKTVIKDERSLDKRFLYYLLCTREYRHEVVAGASGTTVKHTSPTRISAFRFQLPPPSDQRRIAHILGTLDDKIELNRKMNETLEQMARAVFKASFTYPFEGLKRFVPDMGELQLVDSPLGNIPKGWEVGSLSDFALLNDEVWTKDKRPDRIRYVDLTNTKWGRIEAVSAYEQQDAPSRAQRVLRALDTIVGTVRPGNGSYAFILEDGLTGSTGFAVLRPRKALYAEFVYLAVTAADNIEELQHLADGGAYPAVRPEVVAARRVVKPDSRVMARFSEMVAPTFRAMALNDMESRNLAAIRDALLPKLMSGEVSAMRN